MDLQNMGMFSGAEYEICRVRVWAVGQYMDLQCMGMCSGAEYGPAEYGYVLRGSIWTFRV